MWVFTNSQIDFRKQRQTGSLRGWPEFAGFIGGCGGCVDR
jgi:hypothetical protein